jgi:hypothetical protein
MAYYQFSHEVGQRRYVVASGANAGTVLQEAGEFPFGQVPMVSGIPIVLPRFNAAMPVSTYLEKPTEIRTDLLGNARAEQALSLFNYTDDYDFRDDIYIAEIQGLNETGSGDVESAKWAQLENVGTDYSPLPTGYIQHDADRRAIRIELAKAGGGFQRARISTKKRFRYQTGKVIRSSVCLQMSQAELPACEKLWGIGDSLDGFFFQIRAGGNGDDFRVVHRRASGDGLVKEVVVPRSQFNGDKLDGTGLSNATIDFTKNCMYLIEWGWYGASSVRFYAFVVDDASNLPATVKQVPRGRWVLMHELLIPDSLNAPSLGTPALPFTIEISNSGYLVEPQYIIKYGLSLQIDGGESEKADMHAADLSDGRDIGPALGGNSGSHLFPLFALRAKDFAPGNLLNTLQGLPKTLDLLANYPTELVVLRDVSFGNLEDEVGHFNGTLPESNGGNYGIAEALLQGIDENGDVVNLTTEEPEELPISIEDIYTATDMGTLEGNFVLKRTVSGKELVTYYLPSNKGRQVNLTSIYDLVREAITTEYDSKFDFPTANENIEIAGIDGSGVLTLERKHTFEIGFRFVIGTTTFYVRSVPSNTTITLSTSRGGALYNNYAADGIVAGMFGTAFYDLVINQAVASRARPIDQGAIVFAARRVADAQITMSLAEKDAEWMRIYECSTSNSYNVVSPAPEVRAFLNYGLR